MGIYSAIKTLTIPDSVNSIYDVFQYCENLNLIHKNILYRVSVDTE